VPAILASMLGAGVAQSWQTQRSVTIRGGPGIVKVWVRILPPALIVHRSGRACEGARSFASQGRSTHASLPPAQLEKKTGP
jgi:hypothetical protein